MYKSKEIKDTTNYSYHPYTLDIINLKYNLDY